MTREDLLIRPMQIHGTIDTCKEVERDAANARTASVWHAREGTA